MNWQDATQRTVAGLGYELVDLERSGGGLLRVFIDRVPGAAYPTGESEFVTVDDCEAVTRQLQYVLEVEQCDYTRLEVSSPGIERPLRSAWHFAPYVGARVSVEMVHLVVERRRCRGRLLAAGESTIEVEVDGRQHVLPIAGIRRAHLAPDA